LNLVIAEPKQSQDTENSGKKGKRETKKNMRYIATITIIEEKKCQTKD
jgi:hypothetical protein